MSPLELFAASLGAIAVYLTVRQNPWCWPIGLVMVALYAWIFFEVKLYSDMLLQMVYAALQLYGWWQWTRGGQDHDGRSVSRLNAAGPLPPACPLYTSPSPPDRTRSRQPSSA